MAEDDGHLEEPASGDRTASDSLAVLASYLVSGGGLRVPRLVIVDDRGRELIELRVREGRAEVSVRVPSPPAHGTTEVAFFASAGDREVEPSLGAEMIVNGDVAALAEAIVDRQGTWTLDVATPEPTEHL